MMEFDYQNFDRIHEEVLSTIRQDVEKGYDLYQRNLDLYNALPEHTSQLDRNRLTKKMEICEAIKQVTGNEGFCFTVGEGRQAIALQSADFFMYIMIKSHKRLKAKDPHPITDSKGKSVFLFEQWERNAEGHSR
jgi:hypothetical protein